MTIGQQTKHRNDTAVTVAGTVAVTQSGAWTVTIQEPLSVDDNGDSLTVDGTVEATQSGAWTVSVTGTVTTTNASIVPFGDPVPSSVAQIGIRNSAGNAGYFQGQNTNADAQATSAAGNVLQTAGHHFFFNGSTWDRARGDTTNGLDVDVTRVSGTVAVNMTQYGSTSTTLGQKTMAASMPVAIASNQSNVPVSQATAANLNMRDFSANDAGTTLTAINTTYNNVTTSANSADVTSTGYRQAWLVFTLASANTPTDIQIIVQQKVGANYFNVDNDFLGQWIYEDTAHASAVNHALYFPVPPGTFRVRVVATGTTAANTFTISNANVTLRT